jgi:2-keto-4-pentenoate hydratase/2-oxohepta-3-ene-1,7-dioic acid hydratase in catechol pathway
MLEELPRIPQTSGRDANVNIVRYQHGDHWHYGILDGDTIYEASGDPYDGGLKQGTAFGPLESTALLAPVDQPSKIIAIGLNYKDHIEQDAPGFQIPENPIIFLKPPSSLVGHGGDIVLPAGAEKIDNEAELGVVISRRARHVKAENYMDVILGLTNSNDVSARDYQFKDGQWVRAKGFDTFSPVGPAIVTDAEPAGRSIVSRLNGEVCQSSNTDMLLFDVPTLIEFISRVMTLEPGDIIMTGTPAGPPAMKPGDVVEIEVEGLGVLRNTAVAE